jgi:poly(A) polymerase
MKKWFSRFFGSEQKKGRALTGKACGIDIDRMSPHAMSIVSVLKGAGFQAFVVGGAVRDLLLGMTPKDFDVATNAHPEQVVKLFRRARIIGRRFQLVHVYFGREIIEVSTFRAKLGKLVETNEHGRIVADNQFGSLEDDASRRDLTMNALYYDPIDQVLLDFASGVEDIQKKVIRILGDAQARYVEDPVRLLRVARFAAKLGFDIDAQTKQPFSSCLNLLHHVPDARLFDETVKFFTVGHAERSFDILKEEKLLPFLIPNAQRLYKDPAAVSFVKQALKNSDDRVAEGRSVSPGFLFASLLWPAVLTLWRQYEITSKKRVLALSQAIDEVLVEYTKKMGMTRRFVGDIQSIWLIQPRFEKMTPQSVYRLLEHPKFRAGFDFLLLRAHAGEAPMPLAQWWESIVKEPTKRADQLEWAKQNMSTLLGGEVSTPPETQKKKRSRRRSKDNTEENADQMTEVTHDARGTEPS